MAGPRQYIDLILYVAIVVHGSITEGTTVEAMTLELESFIQGKAAQGSLDYLIKLAQVEPCQ